MTKRNRTTLLAATALVAALGLGAVGAASTAEARGWGDGPGAGYGMAGGCGGPGGHGRMMGGGRMGGGPGFGGGRMLMMMDGNGDGAVTRDEFDAFHTLAFTAMDADGDGTVERQAFIDSRQMPAGMMMGPGGGRYSEMRAQMRADRLGARFDMWDTDKNGTVTAAEFESVAAAHFAAMDLDGNGTVTRQEMAAKRMFGPRGPMMGAPDLETDPATEQ
ncbi:hypothetical protein F1188_19715 [Roseospira marina]|uniref:EF-hand domain-containing protein n=1 Tax=Roseospira marina TaxID=140057 RepID=A0A5M6I5K4_9PROT|nr:hypothetical protein [Roseospira marina]KAA5603472.1 hypothetical protein F1188_19715 [Roseospira marina]MBB4316145.1 Ca2+-binding EF-hand superfamily protein [Roseospira marina]MBB5089351.1 Ca2+-binding EF-hand superfamily protein [Roseospira marina]